MCAASCAGYTSEVLSDSLLYAEHAKSGPPGGQVVPSLDDVRLAVQARKEGSCVSKEVSPSPVTLNCWPP